MYSVDRPVGEKSKSEMEKKIQGMGDYVKMSYFQRALRSGLDYDTRKFVLIKLAGIYEERKMFLEAAKMIRSAAEINTTYKEKIKDFMKVVELYIKGADYQEADTMFSKALALGNTKEKTEMKSEHKNYYLHQGKNLVKINKRTQAKIIFEKALTFNLDFEERKQVQEQLLDLYDKLGNVREYYSLKKSM